LGPVRATNLSPSFFRIVWLEGLHLQKRSKFWVVESRLCPLDRSLYWRLWDDESVMLDEADLERL
jgi:hypothetical protein